MEYNLSGKKVLLTGASGGLGLEIAKALLGQNACVALQYNQNKGPLLPLHKTYPKPLSNLYKCDLASTDNCEKLINSVTADLGSINVLINNAGIYKGAPLKNNTNWLDVWEETININLRSAAYLAKMVFNHFVEQDGGTIINISSRAAFRGDTINYLAYSASKSGLIGLTKTIAREGGRNNIHCFSIAPGWIYTKMATEIMDREQLEQIKYEQAIHEWIRPKDIVPMVSLLCTGSMKYATGSNFDINGGSFMQ